MDRVVRHRREERREHHPILGHKHVMNKQTGAEGAAEDSSINYMYVHVLQMCNQSFAFEVNVPDAVKYADTMDTTKIRRFIVAFSSKRSNT